MTHVGRIARAWKVGFFTLLVACDPDASSPSDLDAACASGVAADCRCVAAASACSPSTTAPPAEAGPPRIDGGSLPAEAGLAGAGRDAGVNPPALGFDAAVSAPTDAGEGGTGNAPADGAVRKEDAAVDARAPGGGAGFVGEHGALRVQGNRVVDAHGRPLQLRGMSFFWSQWSEFYVARNVDVLSDDWGATLVRAALGVENEGGYLASPQANVAKVRTIVDRAIERGIYVIIDWHDHNARDHAAQASAFFQEMASAYGKQPHVIFEVFNEPLNVPWSTVKSYAESMIRTIRAAGSENLIIVGTPNWSQDVDVAANDRITSDDNIAYTLHFYANTHKQPLRDKAKTALDRGIALFVTEWGTCSADGNGAVNEGETRSWLGFLREQSISWANWSLNDKAEACSAVQPSGGGAGPWRDDQLTPSGRLVKSLIP